jgi:hypothetical protein
MGIAALSDSQPYLNSETTGHLIRDWMVSGLSASELFFWHCASKKTLPQWERHLRSQWERHLRSAPDAAIMTPAFVQIQRIPCAVITMHCQ